MTLSGGAIQSAQKGVSMANVLGNIGGGAELLEHGIRYVQVGAP